MKMVRGDTNHGRGTQTTAERKSNFLHFLYNLIDECLFPFLILILNRLFLR
jgi:hypothetical protein